MCETALGTYGLAAGRVTEHPGVWLNPSTGSGHGGNKIAAVGLAVRDGITRHGLALNVAPNMTYFDLLISCGISSRGVTSMERELGWTPDLSEVANRLVRAFGEVFGCQVELKRAARS